MENHRDTERLKHVRNQANKELEEENFRADVERFKLKLREAKWWDRFIPFVITIRRRSDVRRQSK